jgi:hypothetical protein
VLALYDTQPVGRRIADVKFLLDLIDATYRAVVYVKLGSARASLRLEARRVYRSDILKLTLFWDVLVQVRGKEKSLAAD